MAGFFTFGERTSPPQIRRAAERRAGLERQVDQIVEAPPRENGMVRARDAARHLPWGSIAAVLAFLLMSAAAIGFYWFPMSPLAV